MSDLAPQETPSDVVARRVVAFRKRRDITRDQLAARCAELGYPQLTGPALANIETGRRAADGRRRRDVTVDELLVLARALSVPPALLMFPVGEQDQVEVLPGTSVPPWDALQWFAGYNMTSQPALGDNWRVPLFLFRKHEHLRSEMALVEFEQFDDVPDDLLQHSRQATAQLRAEIKDVRAEMRRHDLTPPPAVGDLEGIDESPRMFLTGREVDARTAAGEQVRLVDHSRPGGRGKVMKPGDGAKLDASIEQGRRFVEEYEARETDDS